MSAPSFADFVKESRQKRKQEALAQEMLGRGRKTNASGSGSNSRNNSLRPSLTDRGGVTKRSSSAKPDINVKWKHDLHQGGGPRGGGARGRGGRGGSLLNRAVSASQIEKNQQTFDKFRNSLSSDNQPRAVGYSIRGAASGGPFVVHGSNFAPGTTAADIESVMAPIGGEVRCRIISSRPTVLVEMEFATREGAEEAISTYNNKTADGRTLYITWKGSGPGAAPAPRRAAAPQPRVSEDDMEVDYNGAGEDYSDGRFGFPENGRRGSWAPRGPRRGNARGAQRF